MAPGRLAAVLAALCLFISVVALHAEARQVPDCGPLGKHRYRCGGPPRITRSVQALNPEQVPDCGPLGKHRYRCGGPPRITRSVQALNPEQVPDCGPLGKHRYRCGGPPRITRSVRALNTEQLSPTDIHEVSSILGDDCSHAPPASAHELKEVIATSSTSGAAHDGVASIAEDPECGPLEKNRFRCGNPPRIRVRDINALG